MLSSYTDSVYDEDVFAPLMYRESALILWNFFRASDIGQQWSTPGFVWHAGTTRDARESVGLSFYAKKHESAMLRPHYDATVYMKRVDEGMVEVHVLFGQDHPWSEDDYTRIYEVKETFSESELLTRVGDYAVKLIERIAKTEP